MAIEAQLDLMLERHTWTELQELIEAGFDTVVIPCGAVEQHGPHLPLFVDAEHGSVLAERVARRLGRALVAPTIRVGCSQHHMEFKGSISFSKATLQAVLTDYVGSLAHHGFTQILLLPTHGGNFAPIKEMLDALQATVDAPARIHALTDLEAFLGVWRDTVQRLTGRGSQVGGHADIAESSLMLFLHPELVRVAAAESGFQGNLDLDQLNRIVAAGVGSVSANGILGDPTGMTASLGEVCLDDMTKHVASRFQLMIQQGQSSDTA